MVGRVGGKCGRVVLVDGNASFLFRLTTESSLRRFTWLDFAAGEFPVPPASHPQDALESESCRPYKEHMPHRSAIALPTPQTAGVRGGPSRSQPRTTPSEAK